MTLRVVLVTGGLDSTVLLAWALRRGPVLPLHVQLPDRPKAEQRALARVLRHYGLQTLLTVPAVPHTGTVQGGRDRGYVPGRNLYLLATANLVARSAGANEILLATLKGDAQDFRDATSSFFREVEALLNHAREEREPLVRVRAPFHGKTKVEVVRLGIRLKAPLEATWSCYREQRTPCGRCRACRDRAAAFDAIRKPTKPARRRASYAADGDRRPRERSL